MRGNVVDLQFQPILRVYFSVGDHPAMAR